MDAVDPRNAQTIADVPQLDVRTVQEQWQNGEVSILDVREPSEWDLGHIENVQWIPMGDLDSRWQEIDPAKRWVCVCRRGNRSNYVALLLRRAGIDAANMKGGMLDWQARKLPITHPGIVENH